MFCLPKTAWPPTSLKFLSGGHMLNTHSKRAGTLVLAIALALAGCKADKGDTGAQGAQGPTGSDGAPGVSVGSISRIVAMSFCEPRSW